MNPLLGKDSLCDVAGIEVGHYTDTRRPTGCTVIIAREGAVGGVDVRGAAPGTRETDLLEPGNTVQTVHAVVLSGGSAWGLDAAGGVMRWLDEQGIGLQVGPARVPIVPAAVLFDLHVGDHRIRPDAAAGYAACEAASAQTPAQGNVGAGAGATVGKMFGMAGAMKGGIGSASVKVGDFTVGANSGHIESDAHSFYLAGKGSWPVNEQFSVFGKLGVARNHNSVSTSGLAAAGLGGSGNKTALYASVGGEYAINKQVSLALEYEHYGKNQNDFGRKSGAVTASVAYHF